MHTVFANPQVQLVLDQDLFGHTTPTALPTPDSTVSLEATILRMGSSRKSEAQKNKELLRFYQNKEQKTLEELLVIQSQIKSLMQVLAPPDCSVDDPQDQTDFDYDDDQDFNW